MTTATLPGFTPRTRPRFGGAVRSELLKIRRQGLIWALLGLMAIATLVALGAVVSAPSSRAALTDRPLTFYLTFLDGAHTLFDVASGIVLLVAAARLVGMEYSGGTVRVVLARGTARLELLLAQLVALAVTGLLVLAAFVVVAGVFLAVTVVAWHGDLTPLTSLPGVAWTDTGLSLVVALISMGACVLLATAAAAVGRSLPFAIGAALALFPADNFGTIVMGLLQSATGQDVWPQLTPWLLGPNLNRLAIAMQTDHHATAFLIGPLVPVSLTHALAVIGGWCLLFLAAALALTWRRDVLE
jgi:ABC-2 type transport system permease protein